MNKLIFTFLFLFFEKVIFCNPISFLNNSCYLGVFLGWGEFEDNVSLIKLIDFEKKTGKGVAFVPFSVFFGRGTEKIKENLNIITQYGAIPIIRLMPWHEPYWTSKFQEDCSYKSIVSGKYDDFFFDVAKIIKNFEKKVIVTFAVEMNGNWFPWSGIIQGGEKENAPDLFKKAYVHIIEIFKKNNVKNVSWMFHVNGESYPNEAWNKPYKYYPGDEYIDIIGFSLYGKQYEDEEQIDFESLLEKTFNEILKISNKKPIIIAEWGVGEFNDNNKAKWYRNALKTIKKYKKIKAAILYSEKWENEDGSISDLRVDSSKEALDEYRKGISDPYYEEYPCNIESSTTSYNIKIEEGETIKVTVSLNIKDNCSDAEWWILANTPFGWFHYNPFKYFPWDKGFFYTYQGKVCNFEKLSILNIKSLPSGNFGFYFTSDKIYDNNITKRLSVSCIHLEK